MSFDGSVILLKKSLLNCSLRDYRLTSVKDKLINDHCCPNRHPVAVVV